MTITPQQITMREQLLSSIKSIDGNALEYITFPIKCEKSGFIKQHVFSLDSYFENLCKNIDSLAWDVIELMVNKKSDYCTYASDYSTMGDASFKDKYEIDRHDFVRYLIATMLITKQYGHASIPCENCGTKPVLMSGLQASQYDRKYADILGNLYDSAFPNVTRIDIPPHGNSNQVMFIALDDEDDTLAKHFAYLVYNSKPLTYEEMTELLPSLRKIAENGGFPNSQEDAEVMAKYIKTALHHKVFNLHDRDFDEAGKLSCFEVCVSCLSLFAFKIKGIKHECAID